MEAPINFFVYSAINKETVSHSIGMPEYSYYFVLEDFVPVLEKIGTVHRVTDPSREVDALYGALSAKGERCVFLNFTAPHNMLPGIQCPTFHVFAWEYSSMPTETWLDDRLQDWRVALSLHKAAITHSNFAVRAIKEAMGTDFIAISIPCPVWDKFDSERADVSKRSALKSATLEFEGRIFDSKRIELFPDCNTFKEYRDDPLQLGVAQRDSQDEPEQPAGKVPKSPFDVPKNGNQLAAAKNLIRDLTPPVVWRLVRGRRQFSSNPITDQQIKKKPSDSLPTEEVDLFSRPQSHRLQLSGVIYTSIYNPLDYRKNWHDMLSAFIWAHKENKDATLVLKTPKLDVDDFVEPLIKFLQRFAPFDCRIVVLMCYLDDEQYRALLGATSYYVNTSFGEGQCLPLMEYLSAGVPAVAPDSTALADYMEPGMSFIVPSYEEPTNWQHDPRMSYRALRYKVDWIRLVDAFHESYTFAKTDENGWRSMGRAAAERMKGHCSMATAEERLKKFLTMVDI